MSLQAYYKEMANVGASPVSYAHHTAFPAQAAAETHSPGSTHFSLKLRNVEANL